MPRFGSFLAALVAAVSIGLAAPVVQGEGAAPAPAKPFPPEQIEQMVAPIALYPDALIAQMLMASTYPLDLVQADRWLADQEGLEGEALEQAADAEDWDDSVKALVFFPSVLGYMSDNLDWTQDLGDAVLAQQGDIIDAIQRLRDEADAAGSLASNEQQRVEKAGDTIVIQPAQPQVVYVPSYDPVKVYGASAAPAAETYYPDAYQDATDRYEEGYAAGLASGGESLSTETIASGMLTEPATTTVTETSGSNGLVNFGLGALAGGILTAAIMWDDDDDDDRLYYGGPGYYGGSGYWGQPNYWQNDGWREPNNIDIDRNINRERNVNLDSGAVTVNKGIVGNDIDRTKLQAWAHNPERRGGVRYRDNATEQRFAAKRKDLAIDRDQARGRLPDRERPRQAPDLSQVRRDAQASGGVAKLAEQRGDGGKVANLKERAPAAGAARAKVQAQAPGAKAKVQARAGAPAVKARPKPNLKSAAATKRPVNTAAKRPTTAQIKRPAQAPAAKARPAARPAAKRPTPHNASAFKAKQRPQAARASSNRGASSRAKAHAGGAKRGGGGGGGRGRR